jgi:hypothetical protein
MKQKRHLGAASLRRPTAGAPSTAGEVWFEKPVGITLGLLSFSRLRERIRHAQRVQKTLEEANVKLDSVITGIMDLGGRRMIEAMISGVRGPHSAVSIRRHKHILARIDLAPLTADCLDEFERAQ